MELAAPASMRRVAKALAPLALLACVGLWAAAPIDTEEHSAEVLGCEATLERWSALPSWPADRVLIGKHLYTRAELEALSAGESLAGRLAAEMATAQLNIEAGAEVDSRVIEALFAADDWIRTQQTESGALTEDRGQGDAAARAGRLARTLAAFNDWAADAAQCAKTTAHDVVSLR